MARRRRKDAATQRKEWLLIVGAFCARVLAYTIRAVPLMLILVGVAWGARAIWQESINDPRYIIAGDTVSLMGSQHLPPEAVTELRHLGRSAAGRSLLAPSLLYDVRQAYLESPWIHSVHALHRSFPNRIAIEFDIRLPAAQVRHASRSEPGGRYWLVDHNGTLLPVPGARHPHPNLPMIVGTTIGSIEGRPKNGARWNDIGVQEGLALLRLLENSPLSEELHLRKIRISSPYYLNRVRARKKLRPRYYLEMVEGVDVRWGEFNAGDFVDEKLNSEKLADLRQFVSQGYVNSLYKVVDVSTRLATCSRLRQAD